MCMSPIRLPNGALVKCNRCSWCRRNRVKDFVGRALAEQAVSSAALALTLTYAGDVPQATSLYYVDVQLMLKRLRADGFSVRYMCAGEFGEKKGRAHWHCVLFFVGRVPHLPIDRRVDWKYWKAGLVYAQRAEKEGFQYLMKYSLKDDTQNGFKKLLRLSKRPPLGFEFFANMAQRMVDAGLAVHNPEYAFAHVRARGKDGVYRPVKFWLSDTSLDMFLYEYVLRWRHAYGAMPPDTEFLWEKYHDPIAKDELANSFVDLEQQVALRRKVAVEFAMKQSRIPLEFPVQTGWLLLPGGNLAVAYSNGGLVIIKEGEKWHLDAGSGNGESGVSLLAQLRRLGLSAEDVSSVRRWLSSSESDGFHHRFITRERARESSDRELLRRLG